MGVGEESSSLKYAITMASLFLCCINSTAQQTNTLNQSHTLNSTQHLVSTNNTFTLRFFKPSNTSANTYLAIFYSQSSIPIWIANTHTPITNASASLIFDSTGMLLINQTHGDPIHLCPSETTITAAAKTTAVLLDNGNLVVREVNSGKTLWQSFDCPSDSLLPQMKLGVNHRTGKNWTLTSWLTQDDPSPGPFTLEWDPTGVQLVIRRRGVVFWTSGTLKNDIFENMSLFNDLLQYYHMTTDEESFSYSLKDGRDDPNPTSVRWRIGFRGKLEFGHMGVQLENICYGYNTDRGCATWEQPECRSDHTTFVLMSGSFMNADGDVDVGHFDASLGPNDCRVSCWNDCNCQAYKNSDEMGCTTHSRNVKFRPDSSSASQEFYVIQRPQDGTKKIKKWIWIAISVLITSLFVSVIVVIFYLRGKRKGKASSRENHLLQLMTPHNTNELEDDYNFAQHIKVFNFASLVEATNNFSEENKLGEGGFGPVYKAWELWQRGDGLELMDPILSESCCTEQFLRILQVGLLCVEDSPADRPNVSQVISMTTNQSIHLPLVNKPAFMNLDKMTSTNFRRQDLDLEYHSVNGLSISIVDPR
ncbi:G-type lectin S-receptor-like serine/threonine-protein kinase CES101 [Senna tora]|uniref:G-type lectin S-receptor-like serine/threonine-protein kinase CES101 n=1 Tax=Senna tora TaxID=362788 RepID=A0A834TWE7_9FABA|nr:G-type lectin S-receptor-like serine/threonine-protein kinase CES101 [Senna tora]